MAYEEVQSSNNGDFEEREFISAKIGVSFEGTFVSLGRPYEGQYGTYRVLAFDTDNGFKMACRASKILMERLENAGLVPGDRFKVVVESQQSKNGKNTYALPRLYVDRQGGQQPTQAARPQQAVSQPQRPAPAASFDDNPPF